MARDILPTANTTVKSRRPKSCTMETQPNSSEVAFTFLCQILARRGLGELSCLSYECQ